LGQAIICPWKPPDKIWKPPSLLFSGYRGGGGLGGEELSLGPSALVVNLSMLLELVSNFLLDAHMDNFFKLNSDQYCYSSYQIRGFCGGDIQQA
jgi:hypothetical protein